MIVSRAMTAGEVLPILPVRPSPELVLIEQIDDALHAETGNRHARLGVQRDDVESGCDDDDALVLTIRPVRHAAAGIPSWRPL